MFPLIVAVELPSKRGANQNAGDDAKSNSTEQAPSHRRPLIRNPVNLMNGLAGFASIKGSAAVAPGENELLHHANGRGPLDGQVLCHWNHLKIHIHSHGTLPHCSDRPGSTIFRAQ
jgi:hypothetical protein